MSELCSYNLLASSIRSMISSIRNIDIIYTIKTKVFVFYFFCDVCQDLLDCPDDVGMLSSIKKPLASLYAIKRVHNFLTTGQKILNFVIFYNKKLNILET